MQRGLAIIGVVALLLLGWLGYKSWFLPEKPVERNDGLVIAEVVTAKLKNSTNLRVMILDGTIRTDVRDVRLGVLQSRRIAKMPFSTGYFVNLAKLDRSDFMWNEKDRLLILTVPDIRVEPPNIDETRAFDVKTTGLIVTRDAMETMSRRASVSAQRVASEEARKPDRLRKAQNRGRKTIANLFERPLRVAGVDATVRVRYAGEASRNNKQWDLSRSLEEIFAEGRE